MRRLVLVCLLMLLPLQWSVAATGWHGSHSETETQEASWQLGEMLLAASGIGADHSAHHSTDGAPAGAVDEDHACSSDCHVDDPLWLGAPPSRVPPLHAAPPHFAYFAPTSSHIPAGPERPDRLRAA